MSDYSIAIKIAGELANSFKSSLQGAQKGLSGLASMAGKIGGATMKAAAAGIGTAATAAVGLGTAAVATGKEFESAMSQVAATKLLDTSTKKGQAQFQALEDAARECGATTAFSATEAAQALNNLAMAGYDTDKSVAALPTTLNLAGAGALSLEQSASILTAGMASLGIEQTEQGFSHFADILAITASKAKTDVAGIGEAITTVGKTAANLKGGTEEVAASLGILADVDLTGSEGGTHLRNMIMSLQNPRNKNAAEMFENLGLSAYDSQGKMRGLNEIFGDLSKSMAGMTDQEKNNILSTIFKQTDIAAASAMLENCGDRFDELYDAAKNSSEGMGASAEMYAKQMDNLDGDIDILKSSLSDLGISFYKDAGGPLRSVTQAASGMVTQLNNAYKSGGLSAMLAEVGNSMAQIVSGAAKYAPMAVNVGIDLIQNLLNGITQNSGGIASAAGNVLTTFANGIFTLAPQIAFAGIDIIVQLAQSLSGQIPQLAANGTQAVASFVNGLIQRGPDVANAAFALIQALASGIIANAPVFLTSAVRLTGSLFTGFMQMLPQITDIGVQLIESLASGVQNNLPALIPASMSALVSFSGSLRANVGKLVDAGLGLITALAQSLIANIPVFVQTVPTIVTNIAGIINDNAPKLLATGIELIVQLAAGIIQAVPVIISNLPQIVQAIVSVFTAFNWASLGSKVIAFIGNGIKAAIGSIPQIFSNFVQTAHNIVSSFGWQSLGRGIITLISNGISSMITAIPQIFMNLGSFAVQAFKSIDWWGVGTAVIRLIGEAISGAGGFIVDAVKGIGGGIIDGIKGIFGGGDADASDSGTQAAQSYASGIESNAAAASSAVSAISSTAFGGMDFTAATTAGTQSADAFSTGLTDGLAGLSVDMSGIGMDSAVLAANFGQAGAEGAAALGDSLNTGLTAASADTSAQMAQITAAVQDNMSQADSAVQQKMAAMVSKIQSGGSQMVQAASSAAQGIRNTFSSIDLSPSGVNMMQGLVRGVTSMQPQVEAAARSVAQAAANSVNSALQIHSPSRLMDKSGQYVDEGFAGGMLKNAGKVKTAAQAAMAQPIMDAAGMQKSAAKSVLDIRAGVQQSRVHGALNEMIASQTVNNNNNSTVNNNSQSSPAFVYSPTYQFNGNADKDNIKQADRDGQAEFERRMKAFMRKNGRTQFA